MCSSNVAHQYHPMSGSLTQRTHHIPILIPNESRRIHSHPRFHAVRAGARLSRRPRRRPPWKSARAHIPARPIATPMRSWPAIKKQRTFCTRSPRADWRSPASRCMATRSIRIRKSRPPHDAAFRRCVLLAQKLGVEVVTTFSGCPGGAPGDKQPNWVTCPWPPEYLEILEYQWKEAVIPYWLDAHRIRSEKRHPQDSPRDASRLCRLQSGNTPETSPGRRA